LANLLAAMQIDIEELLNDLLVSWSDSGHYVSNASAFRKMSNRGENIMCCCPFHEEESPSFGIRTAYPYCFNCFGCGTSGSLESLVAHVMGLPNELNGYRYIEKRYLLLSVKDRPQINIVSIIDGGNERDRRRTLPESEAQRYLSKRHDYIEHRGFSDHTLNKYEVGYDEATDAITFPVRTGKGLIRFIHRRKVSSKSFFNEKGIYKKDILYGLYYLIKAPKPVTEVYINESITDTMSCYQGKLAAVAIMGRVLFKEQVRELLLAGVKTVNLFFDNDKYGVDCTVRAYELLATTPIKVNVVIYPGGQWGVDSTNPKNLLHKDANDLLRAGGLHNIRVVPFGYFYHSLTKDAIGVLDQLQKYET